jgi:hypothetical protein
MNNVWLVTSSQVSGIGKIGPWPRSADYGRALPVADTTAAPRLVSTPLLSVTKGCFPRSLELNTRCQELRAPMAQSTLVLA